MSAFDTPSSLDGNHSQQTSAIFSLSSSAIISLSNKSNSAIVETRRVNLNHQAATTINNCLFPNTEAGDPDTTFINPDSPPPNLLDDLEQLQKHHLSQFLHYQSLAIQRQAKAQQQEQEKSAVEQLFRTYSISEPATIGAFSNDQLIVHQKTTPPVAFSNNIGERIDSSSTAEGTPFPDSQQEHDTRVHQYRDSISSSLSVAPALISSTTNSSPSTTSSQVEPFESASSKVENFMQQLDTHQQQGFMFPNGGGIGMGTGTGAGVGMGLGMRNIDYDLAMNQTRALPFAMAQAEHQQYQQMYNNAGQDLRFAAYPAHGPVILPPPVNMEGFSHNCGGVNNVGGSGTSGYMSSYNVSHHNLGMMLQQQPLSGSSDSTIMADNNNHQRKRQQPSRSIYNTPSGTPASSRASRQENVDGGHRASISSNASLASSSFPTHPANGCLPSSTGLVPALDLYSDGNSTATIPRYYRPHIVENPVATSSSGMALLNPIDHSQVKQESFDSRSSSPSASNGGGLKMDQNAIRRSSSSHAAGKEGLSAVMERAMKGVAASVGSTGSDDDEGMNVRNPTGGGRGYIPGETPDDPGKRHKCGICGRGFARLYNLKSHALTHDPTRPKPFACPHEDCAKSFSRLHDLERHRQGIHNDGPLVDAKLQGVTPALARAQHRIAKRAERGSLA